MKRAGLATLAMNSNYGINITGIGTGLITGAQSAFSAIDMDINLCSLRIIEG
jgi:hypothetical protein